MSYILEALKKSEKERRRGKVPDLLTETEPPGAGPRRRRVLPYLILAALLLNAAVLMLWLKPWQPGKENGQPQGEVREAEGGPVTAPSGSDAPPPGESIPIPVPPSPPEGTMEAGTSPEAPPPEGGLQMDEAVKPKGPVPADPQQDDGGTPGGEGRGAAAPRPPTAAGPDAPQPGGPFGVNELPHALRQSLPDMTRVAHVYSEQRNERKLILQGRVIREGGYITDEIRLEEITPDGVIIRYREKAYRLRLF